MSEANIELRERNLAAMILRLAARIKLRSKNGPHATADLSLAESAVDLVCRMGLGATILRDEPSLTNGEPLDIPRVREER